MIFNKEETIKSKDPRELFDMGLELFVRGSPEESVAFLREAFFGNLYIAPLLLGIRVEDESLWAPGPSGTYKAAREYSKKNRRKWQEAGNVLRYLKCLWNDPLVRREIQSYWNFCKSYSRSLGSSRVIRELVNENAKFTNKRRIKSTQKEIIERIHRFRFDLPPDLPRASSVSIISSAAEDLVAFLRNVLGFSPIHREGSSSWIFSFHKIELKILKGDIDCAGIEISLYVENFNYYYLRLEDKEIVPVDIQRDVLRDRYIVLEAPGGVYLRLMSSDDL